ncbi:hypothetical protein CKA32_003703 [Geitlerinema sp. FC II]|nr:hypothetical protein CKA32_003703 [Geitlerinema sp. FC II]
MPTYLKECNFDSKFALRETLPSRSQTVNLDIVTLDFKPICCNSTGLVESTTGWKPVRHGIALFGITL